MKFFPFHRGRSRPRRSTRRRRGPDSLLQAIEMLEPRAMLAANLAPENVVPGGQAATVNLPLAFTAYRGNLISVSDPDAGSSPVQVTLSVDKGTITLLNSNPSGSLTYSAGDGTEDPIITFTGTVADINTALSWVSYRPEGERYFQWSGSSGGNGHWYEYVTTGATWTSARTAALARGGYLATLTSGAENGFVTGFVPTTSQAWLGGYQNRSGLSFSEPSSGWTWGTGEAWSYTNWMPGQPDDGGGTEHYLTTNASTAKQWNDAAESLSLPYVVEYESDPRPVDRNTSTLTLTTNDLGNVGTGGAKSDTDTVSITVNP
ncbi:MAG: lectin-like protein, partial [Planctomycetota bacterium]